MMLKEYEVWIWSVLIFLVAVVLALSIFIRMFHRKNNKTIKTYDVNHLELFDMKKSFVKKDDVVTDEKPEEEVLDKKVSKDDFKIFDGFRIIVAEDNIINQKVITSLLDGSGIKIVIANNGQEVLEILSTDSDFSLILMDAHMPVIDGFEATKRIRENSKYNKITIVALSGDTATDDIKKMKEAGMQEHISKPISMQKLFEVFSKFYVKGKKYISNSNLNSTKGIEVCGGDENFYGEILEDFIVKYKNSPSLLLDMLKSKEFVKADSFLLDILDISSNIGADNLHEMAQNIRFTLQNDKMKVAFYLKEYNKQLKILLNEINNYLQR